MFEFNALKAREAMIQSLLNSDPELVEAYDRVKEVVMKEASAGKGSVTVIVSTKIKDTISRILTDEGFMLRTKDSSDCLTTLLVAWSMQDWLPALK